MKHLTHHAALRAIGGSLSALHTCKEREYWTLPESLQDKPDFYNVRDTIPFENLLSGFRDSGFIVYLDKPKVSDALIAAAPDLLAVAMELEESAAYWSEYDVPIGIVDRIRAALAKAMGE